jgi:hypothetical protein
MTTYFTRLEDYAPPAKKTGDAPWTEVRMEETPDPASGDYSVVLAQAAIDPPIVDNENPPSYDFETNDASYQSGWYRIVWIDSDGVEAPTRWLQRRVLPFWAPSVQDVADHILQRTYERGNHFAGTFTENTRPTREMVERVIDKAINRVQSKLGENPTGNKQDEARDLNALRAAMIIELTLFAKEIESNLSPYRQLKELWDNSWAGDEGTGGGAEGELEGVTAYRGGLFSGGEPPLPEVF